MDETLKIQCYHFIYSPKKIMGVINYNGNVTIFFFFFF